MTEDPAIEYVVAMTNGALFRTGGFEEIESLRGMIAKGESVSGTWEQGPQAPWYLTWLNPALVSSITDKRGEA